MPEINLLQNQLQDTTSASANKTKLFAWVMFLVLLVVIGAGVVLYLFDKNKQMEIKKLSEANTKLQLDLSQNQKGLTGAQTYQAQLSNIKSLLKTHVAVSPLLNELEKFTYLRSQYLVFNVSQETGKVHLEGKVDSYHGLAVLLIGLSTSANFENVKLLSLNPAEEPNTYRFSIDMNADSKLFSIDQP